MKKLTWKILLLYVAVLSLAMLANSEAYAKNDAQKVDIIFTHDLHSHIDSYTDVVNGENENVGGIARLSTLLKELRENNPELLVIDGGDMAMGTLYQTLYTTKAPELRLMGRLGFDATTFGNHDFDYSDDKLAEMFEAAADSGEPLPAFCISNIDWNYENESTTKIRKQLEKCNLCEYTVVEKNGVKIAIFGIFGVSAKEDSPTLQLKVDDQIESARRTVAKIKENENVDMIVCISHSGTSANLDKSEDEQLALAVPEIDVILSAHTHTVLKTPIVHGNTYIVSCGCYGKDTGYCNLSKNADGRWTMENYELITMDGDIKEDFECVAIAREYAKEVDEIYLEQFGMKMNQIIAYSPYNFESVDDMYYVKGEHNLGNLMSDAYKYAANKYGGGADIAVVPSGTVRGTFYEGNVTVADAFQCYSLGYGYDNQVGSPLVRIYLTGEEIRLVAEIDATLSDIMNSARLYVSGISYSCGNKRMILNRAYDMKYNPNVCDDTTEELEDNRLYSIVTDMYTARMLGSVGRVSKGLLVIEPKYADGTVIQSDENDYLWETAVVKQTDGRELKAWFAIADYLQSFEKNEEGISIIPSYYATEHGRKVLDDSFSIKQTNKYFWVIIIATTLLITVMVLVMLIIKKVLRIVIRRIKTERID